MQVAVPDVVECAADADLLLFVLPHQFIRATCNPLVGKLKSSAAGISLIKVSQFNYTAQPFAALDYITMYT